MKLTNQQLRHLHYLQEHTKSLEVVLERDNPEQASYILGRLVGEMGHLTEGLLPLITERLTA